MADQASPLVKVAKMASSKTTRNWASRLLRPTFSLRSLLILVFLAGIVCAWIHYARQREDAITRLDSHGSVGFNFEIYSLFQFNAEHAFSSAEGAGFRRE